MAGANSTSAARPTALTADLSLIFFKGVMTQIPMTWKERRARWWWSHAAPDVAEQRSVSERNTPALSGENGGHAASVRSDHAPWPDARQPRFCLAHVRVLE